MAVSKILHQVESTSQPEGARRSPSRSRPDSAGRSPGEAVSVGRRWKLRRNLVIYIASQHGASQRMLADVFDLPHSRIAAILKELRAQYGPGSEAARE